MLSRFWFKMVLFTLMCFTLNLGYLLQHESVHTSIYDDYGIKSEMHFRLNPISPAYVVATNFTDYYRKCDDNCRLLQLQNEIVGYNVIAIMGSIFFVFFLYVMFKEIDQGQ